MIIVATELHVKSFWKFFPFIRHSIRSMKQARAATGCLYSLVKGRSWRIGYTLTAWENREAMLQFRNSGAHKKAMQQVAKLSSRYKTRVWEAAAVPPWMEAKTLLEKADFTFLR